MTEAQKIAQEAAKKVREHIAIEWYTASAVPAKTVQESVAGLKPVKPKGGERFAKENGQCPTLVYFYTDKQNANGRGSRQAQACDEMDKGAFKEFQVCVPARFMRCVKVNVTDVTPAASAEVNTETAPVCALVTEDGTVVKVIKGKTIGNILAPAMVGALKVNRPNAAEAKQKLARVLEQMTTATADRELLKKSKGSQAAIERKEKAVQDCGEQEKKIVQEFLAQPLKSKPAPAAAAK
jgi:hypothetical protein